MRKAGRGAGVRGTGDTGRPRQERGVLRFYSGSRVEGRGRQASILSRGGDARGALPRPGLECAVRPPPPAPLGPLRPA